MQCSGPISGACARILEPVRQSWSLCAKFRARPAGRRSYARNLAPALWRQVSRTARHGHSFTLFGNLKKSLNLLLPAVSRQNPGHANSAKKNRVIKAKSAVLGPGRKILRYTGVPTANCGLPPAAGTTAGQNRFLQSTVGRAI